MSSNFAKMHEKCKNEAKHVAKFAKHDEKHAEILQKTKNDEKCSDKFAKHWAKK